MGLFALLFVLCFIPNVSAGWVIDWIAKQLLPQDQCDVGDYPEDFSLTLNQTITGFSGYYQLQASSLCGYVDAWDGSCSSDCRLCVYDTHRLASYCLGRNYSGWFVNDAGDVVVRVYAGDPIFPGSSRQRQAYITFKCNRASDSVFFDFVLNNTKKAGASTLSISTWPTKGSFCSCKDYTNCGACLASNNNTGSGNSTVSCSWCMTTQQCMGPREVLECQDFTHRACPGTCEWHASCNTCLSNKDCGWCEYDSYTADGTCQNATKYPDWRERYSCSSGAWVDRLYCDSFKKRGVSTKNDNTKNDNE